ncbi:TonB family protein, partial [bacterium]|nr:TonB family protein [bacterium]
SGGAVGLAAVAAWWLLALAALIWTASATIDILRLGDEAYVTDLVAGASTRELVRMHSGALITRAMVGVIAMPGLVITLLAVDQMLLRPRTRWLDEVRRRALHHRAAGDRADEVRAGLMSRARARWSWTGLVFGWIWLAGRGLVGPAAVVLALSAAASIAGDRLTPALGLSFATPDFMALGRDPTPSDLIWNPVLAAAIPAVPLLALSFAVAARGHAWIMRRRLARGDTGPATAQEAARRYNTPLVFVTFAGVVVVLAAVAVFSALPDRADRAVVPVVPDTTASQPLQAREPELLEYVAPDYPEQARLVGLEGRVVVKILVGPEGRVLDAQILEGVDPLLDEAALDAARHTRWTPGVQRGVPVKAWMALPYDFRLE